MNRYFIEDAKCGYDTVVDGCGPHATVASAIKYKEDNGKTGWIYCIHPDGLWPMIALYKDDVYEEIIRGEFPEGPNYEADSFGGLSWNPAETQSLFEILSKKKNNGAANLIRYAYTLCTCPTEEEAELLALGIGHYSDEIEVPTLNGEKEYMEDME